MDPFHLGRPDPDANPGSQKTAKMKESVGIGNPSGNVVKKCHANASNEID